MGWLWLNLTLGALFAAAIIGVPLWLVLTPSGPCARARRPTRLVAVPRGG